MTLCLSCVRPAFWSKWHKPNQNTTKKKSEKVSKPCANQNHFKFIYYTTLQHTQYVHRTYAVYVERANLVSDLHICVHANRHTHALLIIIIIQHY